MSLLQDNIQLARQNLGSGTSAVDLPATLPDSYVSGASRGVVIPAAANEVLNVACINYNNGSADQPSTSLSFFNSGPPLIAFTLKAGSYTGNITSMVLQFNLTTTAAVQLLPTFAWLSRMTIMTNQGSTQFEVYNNQQEIITDFCGSKEAWEMPMFAAAHNCGVDFSLKPALASGTYTFYLSLNSTLLNSIKLNLAAVTGDIRLLLQPAAFNQLAISGTTSDITMNSINLLLNVDQLSAVESQREVNWFNKNTVVWPYASPVSFTAITSTTIRAGTPYSFNLNNTPGLISGIYIIANNATNTATNIYNAVDLSNCTFQVTDVSSQYLMAPMNGFYLRYDQALEKGCQVFYNDANPFKVTPVFNVSKKQKDVDTGKISGCWYIRGTERVQFTSPVDLGGGSTLYNITCIIVYYRTAKLVNGQLTTVEAQ